MSFLDEASSSLFLDENADLSELNVDTIFDDLETEENHSMVQEPLNAGAVPNQESDVVATTYSNFIGESSHISASFDYSLQQMTECK